MKLPNAARAIKGKPIPAAWEALQTFADAPEPKPYGTRVTEFPDETIYYTPRPKAPWGHPWKTALSGLGAIVAPGLVNAAMPRAGRELLTLDGLDQAGKPTSRRPTIELTEPGKDGRSFICVRVMVKDGEAAVEDAPIHWLTLVHRSKLPAGFESGMMPSVTHGGDDEGYEFGYFPLTVLYWTPDHSRVARLLPFAYHHLQHRFVVGTEKPGGGYYPDRHEFRM